MAFTTPTFTLADLITAAGGETELVDTALLICLGDKIAGASTRTATAYVTAAAAQVANSGGRGTAATLLAIVTGTA